VKIEHRITAMIDDGISVTEAARTLKIGRSTAYAALHRKHQRENNQQAPS